MTDTPNTLTKFGTSFQIKAITVLLHDKKFLERTVDIINPKDFDSDSSQWIVKVIVKYFREYKNLPTVDVLKTELMGIEDKTFKEAIVHQLKSAFSYVSDTDLDYIKTAYLDFCKNQAMKNALDKSIDLTEFGQYDKIRSLMDGALRAGQERNLGHNWREDVETRLSTSSRKTVPTPWKAINDITDGGLGPGELGVIVGMTGGGKSWCLSAIGAKAMRENLRVAHYTLELNQDYSGNRYDTIFTGIEPNKLRDSPDVVRNIISSIPGELIIKFYPPKSITYETIMTHAQQMDSIGYKPDIIIIDYADLLRSAYAGNESRYLELGSIYEELRGLAGELQVPVWTCSQAQRYASNDDVIQGDRIAESYSKIMTADFVLSLSRKIEDKLVNTARFHVIKNRFGPDGRTYPALVDTSTGKIEIYEADSMEGKSMSIEMSKGPVIEKKNLFEKFEKFKKKVE